METLYYLDIDIILISNLNIMEIKKLKSLIQYLPGFIILLYVAFLAVTQFIK